MFLKIIIGVIRAQRGSPTVRTPQEKHQFSRLGRFKKNAFVHWFYVTNSFFLVYLLLITLVL